jgi:outer membrane biosynthesis protein TonB
MAMLITPRPLPVQSARERYQQSLEKTRVEGAIAKRGAAGVDAVATPAGRWTKQVNDALGYNWNLFMKQSAEMISTGSVRITFAVDAEGKVHDLHADSTSGTASLRQICEMAVRRTVIPVPPPDLLQSFPDHKVDYTINFNYY